MTNQADKRLETLEKRVEVLVNQAHFQDSYRVQIEKTIGVLDQQLIRMDTTLHKLMKPSKAAPAKKKVVKAVKKPKAKPMPMKKKAKASSKKRK